MADPHSKPPKPAPAKDTMILDFIVVVGVALAVYLSNNITPITFESVLSGEAPATLLAYVFGNVDMGSIQNFLIHIQNIFGVFIVLFLAGIFWTKIKINEIHHHEHVKYKSVPVGEVVATGNMIKWKVVLEKTVSDSPDEWKLAILEADNMLDEILEDQGYLGETLADKLKAMSPSRLSAYQDVWAAHKLRNEIAHGGAMDMELTKKMARDAVATFGSAFKELGAL